jgi:hypothetical protein
VDARSARVNLIASPMTHLRPDVVDEQQRGEKEDHNSDDSADERHPSQADDVTAK